MKNVNPSYWQVKLLATEKRKLYAVSTQNIGLNLIRKIYKAEGIGIHYSPSRLRKLKAAYFKDGDGCDVLLNKDLPKEAKIFALIHELKHHYLDRGAIQGVSCCLNSYDTEPLREKTAEVFAAEFIWPESEFALSAKGFSVPQGVWKPEVVVGFKKSCGVPVSYKFITKRLERLSVIQKGAFDKVKFVKLEWDMYGKPFYLRKMEIQSFSYE